jgi:hypothetical protein
MKILFVADRADDARAIESLLVGEGHDVTTCHDSSGGPCRGVDDFDDCPLESSMDLAVVARPPHGRRGIEEMGSVCAARHRVGVVEIDPSNPDVRSIVDLADAAEREICLGYAAAVTRAVGELLSDDAFEVAVTRQRRRVSVVISMRSGGPSSSSRPISATTISATTISAIADRARAGARRHDRAAQVIDVAVVPTTD